MGLVSLAGHSWALATACGTEGKWQECGNVSRQRLEPQSVILIMQ